MGEKREQKNQVDNVNLNSPGPPDAPAASPMRSTDPGGILDPTAAPDITDVLDSRTLRDLAVAIWEWARAERDILVRERDALRLELQITQASLRECRAALEALALRAERAVADFDLALGHEPGTKTNGH
jgi:hypothetical protein